MNGERFLAGFIGAVAACLFAGAIALATGYIERGELVDELQANIAHINQYCQCQCKAPPEK